MVGMPSVAEIAAAAQASAVAAATQSASAAATAQAAVDAAQAKAAAVAAQAARDARDLYVQSIVLKWPGGDIIFKLYKALISVYDTLGATILAGTAAAYTFLPSKYRRPLTRILIVLIILMLAGFLFYYLVPESANPNVSAIKSSLEVAGSSFGQIKTGLTKFGMISEAFQDKGNEPRLLDLQPFAVKQAGYAKQGLFVEEEAITNALRAGVRSFVLQIDYHEDPKRGYLGQPCLVLRSQNDVLTSVYPGSIEKVCKALADHAFTDPIVGKEDPVVLFLYVKRTPYSAIDNPKQYLLFLSKIATELRPLMKNHLGTTSFGNFLRQGGEEDILKLPLKTFEGKFLILTNAETTLFRTADKVGVTVDPPDDLDYWSNMQVFKNSGEGLGITQVSSDRTANAVLFSRPELEDALSSTEKNDMFVKKTKGAFTIYVPDNEKNPEKGSIEMILTKLGINLLPLDLFSESVETMRPITEFWAKSIWLQKPFVLQNNTIE